MNQLQFSRRAFLMMTAAVGTMAAAGGIPGVSAAEGDALKLWANPVHRVGAQDWSAVTPDSIAYVKFDLEIQPEGSPSRTFSSGISIRTRE